MHTANGSEMGSPPPYTEIVDTPKAASQPVRANLRGGYGRPSLPSEMPPDENDISSAISYFEDRDEPDLHRAGVYLSLVEHTIAFHGETTRNELAFPLPIETYNARDVTSLDWSTFVKYLFPMHDEIRNAQRHSFVGQDTPARRDRILAVIAEWNENFFNPRRIRISAEFSPLPSYSSSQPTAIPSAVQDPYVGSRPLQLAQPTMYRDPPTQWSGNRSQPQSTHRSLSTSSSLSTGSSSSCSVDSIKSEDLEGADLGQIRSALLAFQLDATKKDHLRASVRQLRDEFRLQRQDLSGRDRKELKKEYRNQKKEMKKEIKAVVKEVKATRKADRKTRKAERKSQRGSKRAEYRGSDRINILQDEGLRAEERAAERVRRNQGRGRQVEGRASETAARAQERARGAQRQAAAAVARAQERVADARARGWDGEAAATQKVQEINARAGAAERRAREAAGRARYEIDGGQEMGVLFREG
ncbi:MAG: hypothetical protein ALECFALPRED_006168 [Alectoria fallacina]|uniref:Uncharacterized protein n=1 Tax=Alectoria fallacina TaxID=1903189 RepID=A0A8H3G1F4_9LECA|nr:MAG: hypothetical protein ALECFALPRED_006168 [Alectoria fallacina]